MISDAQTLSDQLKLYTQTHSGLEQRNYLGMSAIAHCPLQLYRDFVEGRNYDDRLYRMTYVGYLFERDLITRLIGLGLLDHFGPINDPAHPVGQEIIAPFDSRFRGHTDGRLSDGRLLECKSVNAKRFEGVQQERRPRYEHFAQVQCYLRYGEYPSAVVIYINRDTFEHQVFEVKPIQHQQDKLEAKAKKILAAIDARIPPVCECGYCGIRDKDLVESL